MELNKDPSPSIGWCSERGSRGVLSVETQVLILYMGRCERYKDHGVRLVCVGSYIWGVLAWILPKFLRFLAFKMYCISRAFVVWSSRTHT